MTSYEVGRAGASTAYRVRVMQCPEALASWGAYDHDDPFPLFADVRELGPVHQVTLADGHAAWLVARYDEARAALNDPRLSKDMQAAFAMDGNVLAEGLPGKAFARHMLAVDPPDHTRLRRLVSAAFSVRRVEALRPRVQSIVDELLDVSPRAGRSAASTSWRSSRSRSRTPSSASCSASPKPIGRCSDVHSRDWSDQRRRDAEYARAKAASDAVVRMLTDLVETKQREPADDLVSALIAARDGDERLDQGELLSTLLQLIIAGHDTTASLIGNSVVALLRYPDQLDALRADPDRMHAAIEEFLRYDAPVPHSTFRYASEPIELGGVTIPSGAQVIISLAAANRDHHHFPSAEALDIGRPDVHHLAFGHGIHFCLGAALARMEGQLALRALLARFPHLRLAVPFEDLHWDHGDGLVLRGLAELPVFPGPATATVS